MPSWISICGEAIGLNDKVGQHLLNDWFVVNPNNMHWSIGTGVMQCVVLIYGYFCWNIYNFSLILQKRNKIEEVLLMPEFGGLYRQEVRLFSDDEKVVNDLTVWS